MKRSLIASAALAAVGLTVAALGQRGQAQAPPYGVPGVGSANPLGQTYLPTSPPLTVTRPARRESNIPPEWRETPEDPAMNNDLLVKPEAGPWMIYIHAYSESKAPSLARALTLELRQNYKLPAYVWNYGDDERKGELERYRKEVERQKEALRQAGLSTDVPIRAPHMFVRVQCAVLLGGYKDFESARRDIDRVRKLPPLDGKRFDLPEMVKCVDKQDKNRIIDAPQQVVAVNPFQRAFPVHNPTVKQNQQSPRDVQDITVLRALNADEEFSLLNCPKQWTLAVKHFQMPVMMESKGKPGGILQSFGLGGAKQSAGPRDAAKHNAHTLAQALRQGNLEAYALHTRFYSIVTIGSYDSKDDPRIVRDQEELTKVNARLARLASQDPSLQMLPQGVPIPVPH